MAKLLIDDTRTLTPTARWLRDAFVGTGRPPEEFPLWDVHSRVESNNQYVAEILADFGMRRQVGLAPIHTDR